MRNHFTPQAEEGAPGDAEGKVRGREDESPRADETEEEAGRRRESQKAKVRHDKLISSDFTGF